MWSSSEKYRCAETLSGAKKIYIAISALATYWLCIMASCSARTNRTKMPSRALTARREREPMQPCCRYYNCSTVDSIWQLPFMAHIKIYNSSTTVVEKSLLLLLYYCVYCCNIILVRSNSIQVLPSASRPSHFPHGFRTRPTPNHSSHMALERLSVNFLPIIETRKHNCRQAVEADGSALSASA